MDIRISDSTSVCLSRTRETFVNTDCRSLLFEERSLYLSTLRCNRVSRLVAPPENGSSDWVLEGKVKGQPTVT